MTSSLSFSERLDQRMTDVGSMLCIGLDPVLTRLPAGIERSPAGAVAFSRELIAATHDLAAAFKPNLGFFAALGREGFDVLWEVREAIPTEVPVILDCKLGDIASTAQGYAQGFFEAFDFDALTINPYMGEDSVAPFLSYRGKGVLMLCKTSNAGSGDIQDLPQADGLPLYRHVARQAKAWNATHEASVGLVVGATYPSELAAIRGDADDLPILMPGLGAQGGDVRDALTAGRASNGLGLLPSASRTINYASDDRDFAEAARSVATRLRDEINAVRG